MDNVTDISVATTELIHVYCQSNRINKAKIVYRVILIDGSVMQTTLELPNIDLKSYEIDDYIQSVLGRVFNTTMPLSYDYRLDDDANNHKTVQLYAYPQTTVHDYIAAINPKSLVFLGVITSGLSPTNATINHDLMFAQFACHAVLDGINFLPWKERLKNKKQRIFYIVIMSYCVIFIMIFGLLWRQSIETTHQQIVNNWQLQTKLEGKVSQLTSLIELDNTLQQLMSNGAVLELAQRRLMIIEAYLRLISDVLPNGVWLRSLVYDKDIIMLKGESFAYADIVLLAQLLNRSAIIQQSHVVSANQYEPLFQFSLMTQLKQNDTN